MGHLEANPHTVLKKLRDHLTEVNAEIDKSLEAENLANNEQEIDLAIDYLNAAIRQLDDAAEHLLATKNKLSS
jgi:hypothetical protein